MDRSYEVKSWVFIISICKYQRPVSSFHFKKIKIFYKDHAPVCPPYCLTHFDVVMTKLEWKELPKVDSMSPFWWGSSWLFYQFETERERQGAQAVMHDENDDNIRRYY